MTKCTIRNPKSISTWLCFLLLATFPNFSEAKESVNHRVLVSANRYPLTASKSASTTIIIDQETIAESGHTDFAGLISRYAGLSSIQSGGASKQSSVFIRGAESNHTLVLLDGIELNDPSSINRAFDFSNINLENIERIEIIKGPQSGLYGSDAMAGVINIITKKGRGKATSSLSAEYGTYRSYKANAQSAGKSGKINYSLGLTQAGSDGFSAANRKLGNGERDGHESLTVSSKIHSQVSHNLGLEFVGRYNKNDFDTDRGGGAGQDDPNSKNINEVIAAKVKINLEKGTKLRNSLALHHSQTKRQDLNQIDANSTTITDDTFKGSTQNATFLSEIAFNEQHLSLIGMELELEDFESSSRGTFKSKIDLKRSKTYSGFLLHNLNIDDFFASASARTDVHDKSETFFTFRLNAGYDIKSIKTIVKSSYGTAAKTPSLFQLNSVFGNPDLKPEKTRAVDIGAKHYWVNGSYELVYFDSEGELIEFGTTQYVNTGNIRQRGLESSLETKLGKKINVTNSSTILRAESLVSGQRLLRRPKFSNSFQLGYKANEKLFTSLSFNFTGKHEDVDAVAFTRKIEPAYSTIDLYGSYQAMKKLKVHIYINNLLNKDYEIVDGFGTAGFSIGTGAKWTL